MARFVFWLKSGELWQTYCADLIPPETRWEWLDSLVQDGSAPQYTGVAPNCKNGRDEMGRSGLGRVAWVYGAGQLKVAGALPLPPHCPLSCKTSCAKSRRVCRRVAQA